MNATEPREEARAKDLWIFGGRRHPDLACTITSLMARAPFDCAQGRRLLAYFVSFVVNPHQLSPLRFRVYIRKLSTSTA